MRISDWSSDVCSSDLTGVRCQSIASVPYGPAHQGADIFPMFTVGLVVDDEAGRQVSRNDVFLDRIDYGVDGETIAVRSEEHTSELQSLMRISYAVFCLKKKQ